MKLRFAMTIAFFLGLFLLINGFIGWNASVLWRVATGQPAGWLFWLVFWIVAFSYVLARLGGRWLPGPFARLLKVIGSYWFAVVIYGLLLLPVADLAAWLLELGGVARSDYVPALGAVFGAALVLILLIGSRNAWSPVVRRYELAVDKPADGRREWTIAVASDLHLGNTVGNRHIDRLVERINAMQPDLILLPGDVIDDSIEPFVRNNMAERLGRLKARLGVYAVLGNHEYFGGHIDEYVKRMQAIGITVLRDEHAIVGGAVTVAGRKDRVAEQGGPGGGGGRLSHEALLAGVDRTKPLILMDHQPTGLDLALAAGVDIVLSGHTHRGQMAPGHLITRRLFEIDWGYLRKGTMHAVVSSGFGSWGPPIRLGSRSEIIRLNVTFAGK
ncbi:MAG: metallophosphoesterase [Paenibacillaceae bacterium]|nr:metallophosphoesterase [Paenibacillaceae bacterium]